MLADLRRVGGGVARGEVVQHDVLRGEELVPCDQFVEVDVHPATEVTGVVLEELHTTDISLSA